MHLRLSGSGRRWTLRWALALVALATVWGCGGDDQTSTSLSGLSVTVANTFQSDDQTSGREVPFGEPETAVVGSDLEFAPFIIYDVDISDREIRMDYVGGEELARVIEPGTVDRYRFTFSEPVLTTATADTSAALVPAVTVESPTTLLVEISEGMEIGDGIGAVISLGAG